MPKDIKTFTLFIAAPGDIVKEKVIIRDLVAEWNRIRGQHKHVTIRVVDWSDTYPQFGNKPQAIINEQIFDESDFVIALFWKKFGSPSGVAESGTAEEIERAVTANKPLLLYFSDAVIPPSEMSSDDFDKIKAFKKKHKDNGLYQTFASEEQFRHMFRGNLSDFMNDLLSGKLAQSLTKPAETSDKTLLREADETGVPYEPVKEIEHKIKNNFPSYWAKLYGIVETGSPISQSMTLTKNNKSEIRQLKEKVAEWESEINSYSEKLKSAFDQMEVLSADELKNEIMPEELWTVGAALSSIDNELWLFKQHYEEMAAYQIKTTVENIVKATKAYQNNPPSKVRGNKILKPDALGFELLDPEATLLSGVIGKGIRSEILHKLAPRYFPLMTRRSVWALFFFSMESSEFVVDQNKEGKVRTVHNWDYLYDYFTYYNHVIFELMRQNLAKHNITLKPDLKYGYVNLFLVDIFKSHTKNIEALRKLKTVK